MNDTAGRVRRVLTASLRTSGPQGLSDETALVDTGVDSLRLLDILVRLEPEFGLMISDRAVFDARLRTVGDLVDFVERQRSLAGNPPTGES